jgi:hypothetical protein
MVDSRTSIRRAQHFAFVLAFAIAAPANTATPTDQCLSTPDWPPPNRTGCVLRELTGAPPCELVCSTTKERTLVPDPVHLGPMTDKYLEVFAQDKDGPRRIFSLELGTVTADPPQQCHEATARWDGPILETQSGACLCRHAADSAEVALRACPLTRYAYSRERRQLMALAMPPPVATRFHGVAVGSHHTCAWTSDGYVFCWGAGAVAPYSIAIAPRVRNIVVAGDRSCALTDNKALCWEGLFGTVAELLPEDDRPRKCLRSVCDRAGACACTALETLPPMPKWGPVVELVARDEQICARDAAGNTACIAARAPAPQHTCVLRPSGNELDSPVWCHGQNDQGQLGDGTTTSRMEPVQVGAPTARSP